MTTPEPKPYRARVSESASRSIHIATSPSDRLTAWHVRDFAAALDANGIPDDALVAAEKNHNTLQTTGLTVRHTVPIPTNPEATDADA